jgi:hypothetical protein
VGTWSTENLLKGVENSMSEDGDFHVFDTCEEESAEKALLSKLARKSRYSALQLFMSAIEFVHSRTRCSPT